MKKDRAFCKDFRTCDGTPGVPGQWAYVSPDGADHILFPGGDGYHYTRDGGLERAAFHSTGGGPQGTAAWWEIWLADGRVLELQHHVDGQAFVEINTTANCADDRPYFIEGLPSTDPVGGTAEDPVYEYDRDKIGYYVTRIRGREQVGGEPAAYVDVTYQDAPFDYVIKRVTDSHEGSGGRQRAVTVSMGLDSSAIDYGHVTQICFPGSPDGSGGQLAESCFDFEYERKNLTVRGGKPSSPPGAEAPTWIQPVDLLRKVTTPEGYGLLYEYADSDPSNSEASENGGNDWGGRLERIHYPSGKLVRLSWKSYYQRWRKLSLSPNNQGQECSCAIRNRYLSTRFTGVEKKEEFLDGDESNTDPGNYRVWSFANVEPPWLMAVSTDDDVLDDCNVGQPQFCLVRAEYYNSTSSMVDPAGNRTEIIYDTSSRKHQYLAGNSAGPQDTAYFGKPLRELYYAVADDGSRKLVKKVEKTWEQRYMDDPEQQGTKCTGVGYAVLVNEKTTYLDDSVAGTPTVVERSFEDWATWDGSGFHGRYETTVFSGNGVGNWEKVAHTDYAIDNESSPGNACSASQQLIDAWLPGVVASQWVGTRP
ncbi:MAG: hypothetical protein Q9Q40_15070, partial [Acidobacteriota bacterium]|nr:hypothetical protein [Acidobacteriota bacterium]